MLAFSLKHHIFDDSEKTPRSSQLRPQITPSPKTNKIRQLTDDKKALVKSLDASRRRSRKRQLQVQQAKEDIQMLQSELQTMGTEHLEYVTKFRHADENARQLQFENDALAEQLELERVLSGKEVERKGRQLAHLTTKIQNLKNIRTTLKEQLDSTREKLDENVSMLDVLESRVHTLSAAVPPIRRARKSDDPARRRHDWATEYVTHFAQPRKWGRLEIMHFAVGLCKLSAYEISLDELVGCYSGTGNSTSSNGDRIAYAHCQTLKEWLKAKHPHTLTVYLCSLVRRADRYRHIESNPTEH